MKSNGDIFLHSGAVKYTYEYLYQFADAFFSRITSDLDIKPDCPLGIVAHPADKTIMMIASCWILNIPFVLYPAKSTHDEFQILLNKIKIGGLIGSIDSNLYGDVKLINADNISQGPFHDDNLRSATNRNIPHDPGSIFGYFFTSGTTNSPKTVPIKRKNVVAAALASNNNIPLQKNELWLHVLPLHHIGGVSIITRALISGSGVFYQPDFDLNEISDLLRNNSSVVAASLVPTQLRRLLQLENIRVHNSFKAILLGGGPVPENLIKESREKSIPVIPSFGMTESTAQCIAMPYSMLHNGPAYSCGKPLHGVEIQIRSEIDDNTAEVLWIKGPQVFDGYLEKEFNTSAFDDDGWFNTGDFATIDDQGFVRIVMRRSDRIVSGGENINPIEIESLLQNYPGVSDVAVIGIPDSEWGQKTTVFLVQSIDSHIITIDDIRFFLKDKISTYKIPKELHLISEIPRTPAGKIKRHEVLKRWQTSD
jgi:o-succinylbenzoate---CoA ligase